MLGAWNQNCDVSNLRKFENTMHAHRYKLEGEEIDHVFSDKDLEINVESKLAFKERISYKV